MNEKETAAIKQRGKAYCMLHMYEQGLSDFRLFLSIKPEDRDLLSLYSYMSKKA
mgnify:FL=1